MNIRYLIKKKIIRKKLVHSRFLLRLAIRKSFFMYIINIKKTISKFSTYNYETKLLNPMVESSFAFNLNQEIINPSLSMV